MESYTINLVGTPSGSVQPAAFLPTFACLLSTYSLDGTRDYSGYQVLRINANTTQAFGLIESLYNSDTYDFWSPPSKNAPTDVAVPEQKLETVKGLLDVVGVGYQVLIDDVEKAVLKERVNGLKQNSFSWNAYHRLNVIQGWQDSMARSYPDLVSVMTIGKSFEGRPLKVMKLSTGGQNKSAIWIDGGIHAREWISPATVTYMANEIVTKYKRRDATVMQLLDVFDWYILPNVNPDGYEYTWTTDRLWRKTRSNPPNRGTMVRSPWEQLFGCCKGADPNRNFNHQWGGKGTSKNKCSEIYHGPSAASETEVKAVQDFVYSIRDQVKLFITFHSYSQMILLPWGYDSVRTEDHDELMAVATKAADKLKSVHGTKYQVGPSPELLYPAAGGSEDWAKGVAGIKFTYCYELRDEGRYGFLLPANQIIPTGQETFEGVKSMAEDVMQYYKLQSSSKSISAPGPALTEEIDYYSPF